MSLNEEIFITTPLFYSSGDPHIGHVFTLVIADTLKKYYELIGYQTHLLTGVDEHGEKISIESKKIGKQVEDFVNTKSEAFRTLAVKMEISSDYFIRTSSAYHSSYVIETFKKLLTKNKIYLSKWSGYRCISCETNYSMEYFQKKGSCELGHPLIKREEESYFLKVLEDLKWLKNIYETRKIILIPNHYYRWIATELIPHIEDLSITRTKIDWGIKLPQNNLYTVYVWFEALLAYFSHNEIFNRWNPTSNTKIIQIIGKEILKFHSIYFPIILKSLNLKLPSTIISHGWLLFQDKKISKSNVEMSKNMISISELLKKYTLESIRFYLVKLNWAEDHTFSETLLKIEYHKYMVNLFGNLINRLKGFLLKNNLTTSNLNGEFKTSEIIYGQNKESQLIYLVPTLIKEGKISNLIGEICSLLHYSNSLVDRIQPWNLKPTELQYMELNVYIYRQLVLSTYLLSPIFSKNKLDQIKSSLSISKIWEKLNLDFFNSNTYFESIKLPQPEILFQKISD